MLKALKDILEVQDLDIKMIQLISLRLQRQKELDKINATKAAVRLHVTNKEAEMLELKKLIRLNEGDLAEILVKIKKLEAHQNAIKKMEEYTALNHEISAADRERVSKEQRLSDYYDKLAAEEDVLNHLNANLSSTVDSSKIVEEEIKENILQINHEGREIKAQRDALVIHVDAEVFKIYERLLHNKKDRVVVPLENRCCSGCHIMLTAQHENLVRKGERLVFCEHCSRVHYWQESKALEDTVVATKQRRRRSPSSKAG